MHRYYQNCHHMGLQDQRYLFNRRQRIYYNGYLSEEFPVHRGVPQGSILGPTLFLLHLNDIDLHIRHCIIIKYADDAVIYIPGKDTTYGRKNQTYEDISEVYKWLRQNDLSLNLEWKNRKHAVRHIHQTKESRAINNSCQRNGTQLYTML